MSPKTLPRRRAPIKEAAAYVPCHPNTIRRYIVSGQLTGYRFGPRKIVVDLDEVDGLLRVIPTAGIAS